MTEMAEQRAERRLAAILAGDVAGYSRLMGADEEDTLARLNVHRHEFLEPKIAEHRGRIVKRTGDGVLIEFASAVDAARCAVEIQRGMTGRNAEVPTERRIEFRIGIHVGDIIVEEDDIFGDGVNIAARLEGIAEPGGVSISEDACRQVQGKVDALFVDIGEQNLKNIARKVRVYRVELNHGNATQPAPNLTLPDGPSIAVLPFQNMSGDVEQDYFCDGMVEDIITGLARIKWLFVIGRNSSFAYKGKSPDIRQVGRDLGVRYVLEGSVRRVGNRVRITSQLVDAQTGVHLWAERYDRSLDDIFALQDEITLSVVGAIEPSLRQAEIKRVERKRPSDLNAYDLLLRAIPLAHSVMPDGATRGLALLAQALAREPDYAAAQGYAAWCHEILFLRGGFREENRIAAIRHAHDARVQGRDDATALALAGFVIGLLEHDHATASDAFEAALSLSPSSAFSYHLGSVIAGWAGNAERAIEWGERALRLSPFDPLSYLAYDSIAIGHFQGGRYEDAVNAARKAIQFNPGFSINFVLLAAPLAKLARLDEAKTAASRVLELQPSFGISKQFNSVGCAPDLTALLTDALIKAGLPP
jgi:adenylate cyclase